MAILKELMKRFSWSLTKLFIKDLVDSLAVTSPYPGRAGKSHLAQCKTWRANCWVLPRPWQFLWQSGRKSAKLKSNWRRISPIRMELRFRGKTDNVHHLSINQISVEISEEKQFSSFKGQGNTTTYFYISPGDWSKGLLEILNPNDLTISTVEIRIGRIPIQLISVTLAEMRLNSTLMEWSI